ncbi:hypothetical protein ACHAXS_003968 [Conticribra weissflogii]
MSDKSDPIAAKNHEEQHHHVESKLHHEANNENWLEEIPQCLCPNCNGPNATTTMHSTTIPFFREICIMTLICSDCNFRNSETIFGGSIQEKGERITLKVCCPDDLNRHIVKSESAVVRIPFLDDFEISRRTQTTETNMCMIDIPHFKEVIIMSLDCDCGYKSKEIKGGGSIPAFGTKITLTVKDSRDLSREVLKSDTSGISIPDLELELDEGGLGGMYTTVEGLLLKIHDRLVVANPFGIGDSSTKHHADNDGESYSEPKDEHIKFKDLLAKLKKMAAGDNFPFTIILSDPLSNSFVGPIPEIAISLSRQAENEKSTKCYEEFVDGNMVVEKYIRTYEQDEALGLNDICTENYRTGDDGCNADNDNGTDQMEEQRDRSTSAFKRGPDHPSEVNSAVSAIPAIFQRSEPCLEPQVNT